LCVGGRLGRQSSPIFTSRRVSVNRPGIGCGRRRRYHRQHDSFDSRHEHRRELFRDGQDLPNLFRFDFPPFVWISHGHGMLREQVGQVFQRRDFWGSRGGKLNQTPQIVRRRRLNTVHREQRLQELLDVLRNRSRGTGHSERSEESRLNREPTRDSSLRSE
jgi:hypothetical protein